MKYSSCTEYWLNIETMKLRGEFEDMYKDIEDPWSCLSSTNSLNNRLLLDMIFNEKRYESILDIGCGLGGITNNIYERNLGGRVVGCDISNTAILKAKSNFPKIDFRIKNLLVDDFSEFQDFELVVMAEVLWYLLDDIDNVFKKIGNLLKRNGFLAVNQSFPNNQRLGKEIIDGIDGFEDYLLTRCELKMFKKFVNFEQEEKVLLSLYSRI